MDFTTREDKTTIYIQIKNDMTFDSYKEFKTVLDGMNASSLQQCVIDMKAVEFIDSAGLGMLLLLQEIAAKNKIHVVIHVGSGQVARMFELAKFDTMFTVVTGAT